MTSSDVFQLCFCFYRQDEIDPAIEQYLQENQGFIDNFARGTAHMFRLVWSSVLVLQVCFSGHPTCSSDALETFLKVNKLSHVIRAHECKAAGFQVRESTHAPPFLYCS